MEPDVVDWGERIPAPTHRRDGLRVVILGSDAPLFSCLAAIDEVNSKTNNAFVLVGIGTDAIVDPRARINAGKRLWQNYTPHQQQLSYDRTRRYCGAQGIDFFPARSRRHRGKAGWRIAGQTS